MGVGDIGNPEVIRLMFNKHLLLGELRGAGGYCGDQGHIPQVPEQVREHHCHALREPGYVGRAGGQSQYDLDHW